MAPSDDATSAGSGGAEADSTDGGTDSAGVEDDSSPARPRAGGARISSSPSVTVREYEPADREAVRALYGAAWSHPAEPAWFDWKFHDNPFVPDPPMLVAERGGEVAGIRPWFDLPMRAGDRFVAGTLHTNSMVHPDHRGEGVFSAMAEAGKAHYAARDRDLVMGFGNENSAPILAHWGWTEVGTCPKWYRVRNPVPLVGAESGLAALAARAGGTLARGYLRVRDALADAPSDVAVRRAAEPAATLAALAARNVPERLHVERTEGFYRWRLASPRLETTTFVAARDGVDRAALVARPRDFGDARAVQLFDLAPLSVGADDRQSAARGGSDAAISALLDAVFAAFPDADLVTAPGTVWRATPVPSRGFVANRSRLVPDSLATGLTLLTTSVEGRGGGFAEPSDWALTGTIIETE
ncbi:MAG: GNAT family N-acetyltransferase [Haloarculaceae archaeon]